MSCQSTLDLVVFFFFLSISFLYPDKNLLQGASNWSDMFWGMEPQKPKSRVTASVARKWTFSAQKTTRYRAELQMTKQNELSTSRENIPYFDKPNSTVEYLLVYLWYIKRSRSRRNLSVYLIKAFCLNKQRGAYDEKANITDMYRTHDFHISIDN